MPTKRPRVVFVKDWLTSLGGSEKQLLALLELYPDAPIYTSVYDPERLPQFKDCEIHELPVANWFRHGRRFELLAPALPSYFSGLKLKADVVISITSGFAKAAHAVPPGKHLCVCNTPLRFAWDFGDDRGWVASRLAPWFRRFDVASSASVDVWLANSHNVARRIKTCYGRESEVVYPPVDVASFSKVKRAVKPRGFVTIGRLVPYKRVDLLVEACTRLALPLQVVGEGPELASLRSLAGPTVTFTGFQTDAELKQTLAGAEAFLFAADEDFGITPVEAMAAGCPVVAYQAGGALETVKPNESGLFFAEQTVESVMGAIAIFKTKTWSSSAVKKQAQQFTTAAFVRQVKARVDLLIPKQTS